MGKVDKWLIADLLKSNIRQRREVEPGWQRVFKEMIENYPNRKKELEQKTSKVVGLSVVNLAGDISRINDNKVLEDRLSTLKNRYEKYREQGRLPMDAMITYDTALDSINMRMRENASWDEEVSKYSAEGTGFTDRLSNLIAELPAADVNGKISPNPEQIEKIKELTRDYTHWNYNLGNNHKPRLAGASLDFKGDINTTDRFMGLMIESLSDSVITKEEMEPFIKGLETNNPKFIDEYYAGVKTREDRVETHNYSSLDGNLSNHSVLVDRLDKINRKQPLYWDQEEEVYLPLSSKVGVENVGHEQNMERIRIVSDIDLSQQEVEKYEKLLTGGLDMAYSKGVGYNPLNIDEILNGTPSFQPEKIQELSEDVEELDIIIDEMVRYEPINDLGKTIKKKFGDKRANYENFKSSEKGKKHMEFLNAEEKLSSAINLPGEGKFKYGDSDFASSFTWNDPEKGFSPPSTDKPTESAIREEMVGEGYYGYRDPSSRFQRTRTRTGAPINQTKFNEGWKRFRGSNKEWQEIKTNYDKSAKDLRPGDEGYEVVKYLEQTLKKNEQMLLDNYIEHVQSHINLYDEHGKNKPVDREFKKYKVDLKNLNISTKHAKGVNKDLIPENKVVSKTKEADSPDSSVDKYYDTAEQGGDRPITLDFRGAPTPGQWDSDTLKIIQQKLRDVGFTGDNLPEVTADGELGPKTIRAIYLLGVKTQDSSLYNSLVKSQMYKTHKAK